MKTHIRKQGDTIYVSIDGKLEFDTHIPFRDDLGKVLRTLRGTSGSAPAQTDSVAKEIIFDLSNLEFVGSSGISAFIRTLQDFNSAAPIRPRYCNVKSEFKRMMQALDTQALFDFYEPSSHDANSAQSRRYRDH